MLGGIWVTLNELCVLSRGKSIEEQSNALSQFYHELSEAIEKEVIADFDSKLLDKLDIYTSCVIVSIYEYLCHKYGIHYERSNLNCPKGSNSVYLLMKENVGEDVADIIYSGLLSKSIEPFKSHGVLAESFNFAV